MSDLKIKRIDAMRALIVKMAAIIRELDENGDYPEYWLNDGNADGGPYCPALEQLEMRS